MSSFREDYYWWQLILMGLDALKDCIIDGIVSLVRKGFKTVSTIAKILKKQKIKC